VRRPLPRHVLTAILATALTVVGLIGAYRYWESYYQHRGFATVAFLPHARRGRRLQVHFFSAALHREADYYVYLPPGYSALGPRYPVYYLLHGSPGRPEVYYGIASMGVRMDNLVSLHRMRPMILIFPDGRMNGSTYSDSEWANTGSGAYESYVLDVVRDVDARFATIATRGARVIAGFSMGGYGAANIALHHPDVFGNVQSWSGYYTQTRTGVFAGASRATLAYNSPLLYVRRLSRQLHADPIRAFLFTGRDDDASVQVGPMASALAAAGGSVRYALYRGGHDWQLWHAHLNQMLKLASSDVSAPLRAGHGQARSLTPGVVPIPHGAGRHHRRHGRRAPAAAAERRLQRRRLRTERRLRAELRRLERLRRRHGPPGLARPRRPLVFVSVR
jgi:enterochelin esterase-like enzyme